MRLQSSALHALQLQQTIMIVKHATPLIVTFPAVSALPEPLAGGIEGK